MFERFTEDAHRVVTVAVEEAGRRGDARIGTEHLLLGVFGSEAAESLGLSPETLRMELDRLDAEALESAGVDPRLVEMETSTSRSDKVPRRHMPFTGAAKTTLKNALQEAIDLKHRHIGAEHVALALTTLPGTDRATRVLHGMDLDPTDLRASVLRVLRRVS